MPTRPRDPSDPDFPHGSLNGYRKGCRAAYPCPGTPTCRQLYQAYSSERQERLKRGETLRYRADAVRAYAQSFMDDDWPLAAVTRAAGLSPDGMSRIMNSNRTWLRADTAHRILAVNEERLLEHAVGYVPVKFVRWKLGSLTAIGWSCPALAERLGYNPDYINDIVTGKRRMVMRAMVDDVDTLFEQLRNVPFQGVQANRVRRTAARYGFRTPDEYAPDGRPWDDATDVANPEIEERWARRDRVSLLIMRVVHLSISHGYNLGEVAERLDMTSKSEEREIARIRTSMGLRWTGGHDSRIEDGQEARIAEILAVVERWRQAGPLADPFPFCRELGYMKAPMWANLDRRPKLEAA